MVTPTIKAKLELIPNGGACDRDWETNIPIK